MGPLPLPQHVCCTFVDGDAKRSRFADCDQLFWSLPLAYFGMHVMEAETAMNPRCSRTQALRFSWEMRRNDRICSLITPSNCQARFSQLEAASSQSRHSYDRVKVGAMSSLPSANFEASHVKRELPIGSSIGHQIQYDKLTGW